MSTSMFFTVDGRDYTNDIEGGINAMVNKAVMERVEERLKDLMGHVEAQGGTISFDIKTNQLSINHCSEELIKKIQERF